MMVSLAWVELSKDEKKEGLFEWAIYETLPEP